MSEIIPALPEKFHRDDAGGVRRIGDRFNDFIASERSGGLPQWLIDEYGYHSQSDSYDRTLTDGQIVSGFDLTRPGKRQEEGKSITVLGADSIWVWSTTNLSQAIRDRISNSTERDGRYFDPFGFYVYETHAGDFNAAIAAILDEHPDWRTEGVVVSDGYRIWRDGDNDRHPPQLEDAARHGLIGRWLDLLDGETEATAAAMGASMISISGMLLGRSRYWIAGKTTNYGIVNVVVVGPTSLARKGMADDHAWSLAEMIDVQTRLNHKLGGFGSGEALIEAIQDPDAKGRGRSDKRAIYHANEFSSMLKIASRQGSILSEVQRDLFDGQTLRTAAVTRGGTRQATDPNLSILAATTPSELKSLLDDVSLANGFANRFLFVWSRSEIDLPFGGEIDVDAERKIAVEMRKQINQALSTKRAPAALGLAQYDPAYRVESGFTSDGHLLWKQVYGELKAPDAEGLVFAMLSRGTALVRRIAMIFAALDGEIDIDVVHLEAALAWWRYSAGTAQYLFGGAVENPAANRVLDYLRQAAPNERARTEISEQVFNRNLSAPDLTAALDLLVERKLIAHGVGDSTGGRRPDLYVAISPERR